VGPRSDLYSLGVIFHEMLTGRRPYAGGTIIEILAQHISAPVPKLPAALALYQPLLDGLLAKRADDRFESAEAVLAEIDAVWTRNALQVAAL
jgi:serine/threonine protein kinase